MNNAANRVLRLSDIDMCLSQLYNETLHLAYESCKLYFPLFSINVVAYLLSAGGLYVKERSLISK